MTNQKKSRIFPKILLLLVVAAIAIFLVGHFQFNWFGLKKATDNNKQTAALCAIVVSGEGVFHGDEKVTPAKAASRCKNQKATVLMSTGEARTGTVEEVRQELKKAGVSFQEKTPYRDRR